MPVKFSGLARSAGILAAQGDHVGSTGRVRRGGIYVAERTDCSRVAEPMEGSVKSYWTGTNLIASGKVARRRRRSKKRGSRFIRHDRYWKTLETAHGKDIRSQGSARREEKLRQPANDESSLPDVPSPPPLDVPRSLLPFLLISRRTPFTSRLVRAPATGRDT